MRKRRDRKLRDPRLMRALGFRALSSKLAGQGDKSWEHYFKVSEQIYAEVRRDRERAEARKKLKP